MKKLVYILLGSLLGGLAVIAMQTAREYSKEYPTIQKYIARNYDAQFNHVRGITLNQLQQHHQLYAGYVNKRNEIATELEHVSRQGVANITYSPFRALKVAQTFARNGSLLHEYYFEALRPGSIMGEKTTELLIKNFGSIDAYKQDILDCARCARGWAITCYNLDDGSVSNYVLEAHHDNVPVLTIPLVVVDVYEHAYMIDFGIKRADYLQTLWDNIDWDIIERRIAALPIHYLN